MKASDKVPGTAAAEGPLADAADKTAATAKHLQQIHGFYRGGRWVVNGTFLLLCAAGVMVAVSMTPHAAGYPYPPAIDTIFISAMLAALALIPRAILSAVLNAVVRRKIRALSSRQNLRASQVLDVAVAMPGMGKDKRFLKLVDAAGASFMTALRAAANPQADLRTLLGACEQVTDNEAKMTQGDRRETLGIAFLWCAAVYSMVAEQTRIDSPIGHVLGSSRPVSMDDCLTWRAAAQRAAECARKASSCLGDAVQVLAEEIIRRAGTQEAVSEAEAKADGRYRVMGRTDTSIGMMSGRILCGSDFAVLMSGLKVQDLGVYLKGLPESDVLLKRMQDAPEQARQQRA